MSDEEDNLGHDGEEEMEEADEGRHSSLVEAICELDNKQHVKPASRKEASLQVSEFHLTNHGGVHVPDLGKVLQGRASHAEIWQKLKKVHRRNKTLPKPLEKPEAERINRTVAFQNARQSLDRWDAVVQRHRLSDELHFPLNKTHVRLVDSNTFLSKFKAETPLERELAQLLYGDPDGKKKEEDSEMVEHRLTLKEVMAQRKEMARLRARQSYMMAKNYKQNKIKSKRYHRLLKREKLRNQLSEFEAMQKSNPELAIQKLEEIERTRALERVSLRHRSTGKWAKNQVIRAKYDDESRKAIAEQLAVSRELMQKVQADGSSDEEAEVELPMSSKDNPWLAKSASEIEEFVSGYRKYWQEKNAERTEAAEKLGEVPQSVCDGNGLPKDGESSGGTFIRIQKNIATSDSEMVQDEPDSCGKFVRLPKASNADKEECLEKEKKKGKKGLRKRKRKDESMRVEETAVNMSEVDVDELFDKANRKLSQTVSQRLSSLRAELNRDEGSDDDDDDADTVREAASADKYSESLPVECDDEPGNRKQSVVEKMDATSRKPEETQIDPKKFIAVKTKNLKSSIPDLIATGDDMDDDENAMKEVITEAFADDDVQAEFRSEKETEVNKSKGTEVDLTLPGWGNWGGKNIKPSKRKRKRFTMKFPQVERRRDENKGDVIIYEDKKDKIKQHQVREMPFPFTSVKEFEASIRAPVGRTWLPETAHAKLIAPSIVTKMGTIIEPMDEEVLVKTPKV